jgi:hypothetical protein
MLGAHSADDPLAAAPSTTPQSIVAKLAQLANLHAADHLTDPEFADLKCHLVGR